MVVVMAVAVMVVVKMTTRRGHSNAWSLREWAIHVQKKTAPWLLALARMVVCEEVCV
jgi:hypothetical protein